MRSALKQYSNSLSWMSKL